MVSLNALASQVMPIALKENAWLKDFKDNKDNQMIQTLWIVAAIAIPILGVLKAGLLGFFVGMVVAWFLLPPLLCCLEACRRGGTAGLGGIREIDKSRVRYADNPAGARVRVGTDNPAGGRGAPNPAARGGAAGGYRPGARVAVGGANPNPLAPGGRGRGNQFAPAPNPVLPG